MQPSRPKVKSGETKPPWNDQDKDAKEAGSTAGDHMGAVENLMGKATALLRSLRLNRLKAARLKSMELDQRDGHSQVLGARGRQRTRSGQRLRRRLMGNALLFLCKHKVQLASSPILMRCPQDKIGDQGSLDEPCFAEGKMRSRTFSRRATRSRPCGLFEAAG